MVEPIYDHRFAMSEPFEKMKFEVGNYKFLLWCNERKDVVFSEIEKISIGSFTEDDTQSLKDFFTDMGKWETLRDTVLNILRDDISNDKSLYGYERYDIEYKTGPVTIPSGNFYSFRVTFAPTLEDSRRSERRSTNQPFLLEIANQIKNIAKWTNLKASFNLLYKYFMVRR